MTKGPSNCDGRRLARGTEQLSQLHASAVRFDANVLDDLAQHLQRPLAAIVRELHLIQTMPTPDVAVNLHRITGDVAVLARIANELADVVAMERGRLVLERRMTELRSLLGEVLDGSLARRDRARCAVKAPAACLAWVDASRLERVVLAFLEVALRASPHDDVVIELVQDRSVARLSVTTRQVMSSLEVDRVFDRSESGIGMYAARCIVEAHGGAVSCTSEPRRGTCYTADVPLQAEDDRLRVLIVDDDTRQLGALALLLRREGLDVATATSGSSAVCTARALRPDVAIVDVVLPDVTASDLVEQLRDACAWLSIIMASGHAVEDPRVIAALAASQGRFLAKPIDVEHLMAEIEDCSHARRAR